MIFPEFEGGEIRRKKIIFSGRVQRVGFRYELRLIASKLGLSGFTRNLENGNVEAEVQGEEDKIDFLISAMRGIPRIVITDCVIEDIPLKNDTGDFSIIQ